MILDENHRHPHSRNPGPRPTHHLLRSRLLEEVIGSSRLPTPRIKFMNKELAIIAAKTFRKEADELLQRMKDHGIEVMRFARANPETSFENSSEVIAQHIISTRDLESCIMRQGMALKYIGTPNPYPNSKDPTNLVVEPTADGLKL